MSQTVAPSNPSKIFEKTLSLAPMVRAGSLPFRMLCLKYGADLVWSEEIIDKRLLKCCRVENLRLGTVDFPVVGEKGRGGTDVMIFRTCAQERHCVVFQLGTSCPERALQAARLVERDVAAIDINMGCPKKFSVQGGMGAALLTNQDNACKIIATLSSNLSIPVTAKIRLLDSVESTAEFMRRLEAAGAAAITVHLRTKNNTSLESAQHSAIRSLAAAVEIPVLANGDIYTREEMHSVMTGSPRGAGGVMLGRPALLNPSIFRHLKGTASSSRSFEESLPTRTVIKDFLIECIKYEPPFQIIKYTVQEMNSQRRHRHEKLVSSNEFLDLLLHITKQEDLKANGLKFGRLPEYIALSSAGSLSELCQLFDVELPDHIVDIKSTKQLVRERRSDDLKPSKKSRAEEDLPPSKLEETAAVVKLPDTDLKCDDSYFEGETVQFFDE